MQPKRTRRRSSEGIVVRHSRSCSTANGGACNCEPGYRAQIYTRSGEKIRRTFSGRAAKTAARQWRADALSARGKGELTTPTRVTVGEVAALWLEGATAEPPTVRRKNGEPFKPSYVRTVGDDLRLHVLPEWSGLGLSLRTFERFVQPPIPLVRLGRKRLVRISTLEKWSAANESRTLEEHR